MIARHRLLLPLIAAAMLSAVSPGHAQACRGDCNGDGSVTVEEIVASVQIALGDASSAVCPAVDANGDFAVTVNELLAAVRNGLQGCESVATPTATAIVSSTPTATPGVTPADDAALAAAAGVVIEPLVGLFDLQEGLTTAVVLAGQARRTARGGSGGGSGCQQLDCELFGTQQVCCGDGELRQTFDHCTFNAAGGPGSLNGQFIINTDSAILCSGALPIDASFSLVLDDFTHDIKLDDGSLFFRSVQQLSEHFEQAPTDCAASELNFFGLAERGSGRRLLDGVLRRFQTDGTGGVMVDAEFGADHVEVVVSGAELDAETCRVAATLNGVVSRADFRAGTQTATEYSDFSVFEDPQDDGTLLMELNGTADTDCLGAITVATVDPLNIKRAGRCFTSGAFAAQLDGRIVAATYGEGGSLDLDFGMDGDIDRHFTSCTEVPIDQCSTNATGVCGACTDTHECRRGLACFACAGDCSGDLRRCSVDDASLTCADGSF
jgi:hypothetical protein